LNFKKNYNNREIITLKLTENELEIS